MSDTVALRAKLDECVSAVRLSACMPSMRGVRGEGFGPVSIITACWRCEAKGLDAHVPLILRGDALYDPDLDRFLLDLPLAGIRSRHSLRDRKSTRLNSSH